MTGHISREQLEVTDNFIIYCKAQLHKIKTSLHQPLHTNIHTDMYDCRQTKIL
jgi:ribosome-associated translation inhibitor RaiA